MCHVAGDEKARMMNATAWIFYGSTRTCLNSIYAEKKLSIPSNDERKWEKLNQHTIRSNLHKEYIIIMLITHMKS